MAYPDRSQVHQRARVDSGERKHRHVGITDYAQQSLGDIVFVELPKVGAELTAGKTFGRWSR